MCTFRRVIMVGERLGYQMLQFQPLYAPADTISEASKDYMT